MSASDIMISVAVRISVRVCQQVTSCEFLLANHQIQMEQHTFQAFNTTTLAYNPSIFTVATTYRENVGSGCISSLIRLVIIIRLRICQRVTFCEFVCKSSNTDGAKQQTFQAFNTTTLAYNSSIFTVTTTLQECS